MASVNREATAAADNNNINPLLLASARLGSWEELEDLFGWEDAQHPPLMIATEEFLVFRSRARASANRRTEVPAVNHLEEGTIPDALDAVPATRDIEEGVIADRGTAPAASDVQERVTPDDGDNAPAAPDVQEGDHHQQPASILHGVTPDGDTALHAVAGTGDGLDFLKYASMIYGRDSDLLFVKNHNGDTPLHCAARAGNSKMVSLLIDLAVHGGEGPDGMLKLLRMENKNHETALHQAVRIEDGRTLGPKDRKALLDADGAPGDEKIRDFVDQQEGMTIVKQLMGADPQLANYPAVGISPLYLAILLGKSTIGLTLYDKSGGNLSYSGADGQIALHVAVLRDRVMVELLLDWNKSLTTQVDKDGSTALHFACASAKFFWTGSFLRLELLRRPPWCWFHWFPFIYTKTHKKIFEANPAALFLADNKGLFPIHVAASVGATKAIKFFVRKRPDSAGLRDAKGKTFLHVAIEKRRRSVVSYACGDPSLAWILNLQDSEGNTPLHLAIQSGNLRMFCALFGNRAVNLNLTNNKGETPLHLSRRKIPPGVGHALNAENNIRFALLSVGANYSALRWDKTLEKYNGPTNSEHKDNESKRLTDATQTFIVASVLIATMAFSATFAVPGGYRADDHTNGGTPTLAGGYIFDTFIMAAALAFICSLLATTGFMLAGIPMINLVARVAYFITSEILFSSSVSCLSIAFALGVYMVLAPVAPSTAVAICAITPAILLGNTMGSHFNTAILARPLCIRKGLFRGMMHLLAWNTFQMIGLWPFVVIFGWGGLARIHHAR